MGDVWERQIRLARTTLMSLLHTDGRSLNNESLRTLPGHFGRRAEQTTNMTKQHSHHEVQCSFATTWSFCEG